MSQVCRTKAGKRQQRPHHCSSCRESGSCLGPERVRLRSCAPCDGKQTHWCRCRMCMVSSASRITWRRHGQTNRLARESDCTIKSTANHKNSQADKLRNVERYHYMVHRTRIPVAILSVSLAVVQRLRSACRVSGNERRDTHGNTTANSIQSTPAEAHSRR